MAFDYQQHFLLTGRRRYLSMLFFVSEGGGEEGIGED
jgi:hypothetical protein